MEKRVRLFLGFEVEAPWPKDFGKGRLTEEKNRHLTFLFLGQREPEKVIEALLQPPPFFALGLFDKCLFLPARSPHVVAWHAEFLEGKETLLRYRKDLISQFQEEEREFLPHVTLARDPREIGHWKKSFQQLPFFCKALHLYESLGNSRYQILWSAPLLFPFKEISHTADVAFQIYGHSLQDLHLHAEMALSFLYPELLSFFSEITPRSLDELIISLNEMVTKADSAVGCPFKAVSFHGDLKEEKKLLSWEMIVDV